MPYTFGGDFLQITGDRGRELRSYAPCGPGAAGVGKEGVEMRVWNAKGFAERQNYGKGEGWPRNGGGILGRTGEREGLEGEIWGRE